MLKLIILLYTTLNDLQFIVYTWSIVVFYIHYFWYVSKSSFDLKFKLNKTFVINLKDKQKLNTFRHSKNGLRNYTLPSCIAPR